MFTFLTIGAAWFAFGYSVTDLFMNYRSEQRMKEFMKEFNIK